MVRLNSKSPDIFFGIWGCSWTFVRQLWDWLLHCSILPKQISVTRRHNSSFSFTRQHAINAANVLPWKKKTGSVNGDCTYSWKKFHLLNTCTNLASNVENKFTTPSKYEEAHLITTFCSVFHVLSVEFVRRFWVVSCWNVNLRPNSLITPGNALRQTIEW